MSNSLKQVKIGVIMSYFAIVLNVVSGLIYTPWMVEQIGKSDYGIYTLSHSLISLFLVDFGLGSSAIIFISRYLAEDNKEKINNFLNTLYKLYFIIDALICVVFIIIFCYLDIIYQNLIPAEIEKLKVVFCISAVYSLIGLVTTPFSGILNSYEKFVQLKFADILYRLTTIIFNVIILSMGLGLYALVSVNAICGVMSIAYKYHFVRKCVRVKFTPGIDTGLFKEVFFYSIWTTVFVLAERLVINITPSILGIMAKDTISAVAIFGVVMTLEGYICLVANVFSVMFIPKIAKIISGENATENLNSFCIKVGRIQFLINALVICGFCVIGKEFVLLWMGEEFVDASKTLLFITIPALFVNATTLPANALAVKGYPNYQAYTAILPGLTNIILIFPLTYYLGVIGAGISIGISYIVRIISVLVLTQKKVEIKASGIVLNCFVKLSFPLILSTLIALLLTNYINMNGWFGLIIKGFITVAVYGIVFWLIGLNKDEKEQILNVFYKIKNKLCKKNV